MFLTKFFTKKKYPLEYEKLNFKFNKIGSYCCTEVEIKIIIPFQKLHLLYKLPLLIYKAYWGNIYNSKNGTKQITTLHSSTKMIDDEDEHLNNLTEFDKAGDKFENFPHLK